jgi:hypothetical protein
MHRGAVFFHPGGGGAGDSGVRVAHNFGVSGPAASAGTTTAADSVSPFATRSRFPSGRSPTSTPGCASSPFRPSLPHTTPVEGAAPGAAEGETVIPRIRPCVSHRRLRTLTARRSRIGTSRCCRPTLTGSTVTTTASDVRHRAALAHEAG